MKRIAEVHGGRAWVESEPGAGSTFVVYLPAADRGFARDPVPVACSAPRGLGETVVLAEDEGALRALLGRVLSGSGYQVISGRNGVEALEAVRSRGAPVDLLLTDIVMPRMTGTELAAALVSDQPGLKVLYMTGNADEAASLGALGDGAELIQKPFSNEMLLGQLRRLLGTPGAGA